MGNCTVQSRMRFRQNRIIDDNLMLTILMHIIHTCLHCTLHVLTYVCIEAWMAEYLPNVH